MLTLIAFLVTLGILIAVHEYGHFQVARWCNVKVLRFSLGFGKPIFSRRFGADNTEFVISALPLGGYVKMLDERELPTPGAVSEHDLTRAFNRQSVWKRIAIVAAGPAANLLLAIVLYWVLFMQGVPGMRPVLGDVPAQTAAAQAGLKAHDLIIAVAGDSVSTWTDVRWKLLQEAIKSPAVTVKVKDDSLREHETELKLDDIEKEDFESDFLEKLGLVPYRPAMPARLGEILPDGAAANAGLQTGDEILAVNDKPITEWEEFVTLVREKPEQPLTLRLKRGERELDAVVIPQAVDEHGKRIGRIGAAYQVDQGLLEKLSVTVRYDPLQSFSRAVDKTWETSVFSIKMLARMVTGEASWKGVSGPVTIASYAGQSAHIGWKSFVGFLALISISLGVLNLLPVPVLDGGHLLYYTIEIFKGSPVSEAAMEVGQRIGLAILALLMTVAFYNDITRFITG
ncbi:RIP metalloprotease RseP [Methylobacillus flagellatus]|uniref:Zinc metalloprotease n=1 Tax=Methylobacillus flagellatus (strain ATCC 51484 / DSM 6875 / VKM B-1610 / KT) TaxID=265072 RepID=Q1H146_METFK|nr:RIP metalloprotease RseP [Methylobacillus flagellatus]ABE49791.1 Peptidase M50, putative membrane-associated zinc metallopeptidase [Methylobacillus flagellatus KT]